MSPAWALSGCLQCSVWHDPSTIGTSAAQPSAHGPISSSTNYRSREMRVPSPPTRPPETEPFAGRRRAPPSHRFAGTTSRPLAQPDSRGPKDFSRKSRGGFTRSRDEADFCPPPRWARLASEGSCGAGPMRSFERQPPRRKLCPCSSLVRPSELGGNVA